LVLDEADRLIEKAFFSDVKIILESFPKERQTLLFTATHTAELKKITKISLRNPIRVILTDHHEQTTPKGLSEYYAIVPLSEKFNSLYSFIRSHRSSKIVVFLETIKLVRYVFESFRHLRPGIPLCHLTGKQSAESRFTTCQSFAQQKRGVIFATDVAAVVWIFHKLIGSFKLIVLHQQIFIFTELEEQLDFLQMDNLFYF
jgi:ATP-dependent RNA helicase DDX10/DBP4